MEKNDLLTINIQVSETQLPLRLTIPSEKEDVYRNAGSLINAAIKEYRKQFQVTPLETILSMVLFNFAVKGLTTAANKDMEPLLEQLQTIDNELKAYLKTEVSE